MARQRHQPTDELRARAESFAAVGVPQHTIAQLMGITTKTLLKYYAREIDLGKVRANAAVAGVLYRQAMKGNTTAAIFWMKAQAGWRDRGVPEDPEAPAPLPPEGKKARADREARQAHEGTEWDSLLTPPASVQ